MKTKPRFLMNPIICRLSDVENEIEGKSKDGASY
jgi:hypothetical protein